MFILYPESPFTVPRACFLFSLNKCHWQKVLTPTEPSPLHRPDVVRSFAFPYAVSTGWTELVHAAAFNSP